MNACTTLTVVYRNSRGTSHYKTVFVTKTSRQSVCLHGYAHPQVAKSGGNCIIKNSPVSYYLNWGQMSVVNVANANITRTHCSKKRSDNLLSQRRAVGVYIDIHLVYFLIRLLVNFNCCDSLLNISEYHIQMLIISLETKIIEKQTT